jgi:hypothetical protein
MGYILFTAGCLRLRVLPAQALPAASSWLSIKFSIDPIEIFTVGVRSYYEALMHLLSGDSYTRHTVTFLLAAFNGSRKPVLRQPAPSVLRSTLNAKAVICGSL